MQTLRAGCSKADPQTNKYTNRLGWLQYTVQLSTQCKDAQLRTCVQVTITYNVVPVFLRHSVYMGMVLWRLIWAWLSNTHGCFVCIDCSRDCSRGYVACRSPVVYAWCRFLVVRYFMLQQRGEVLGLMFRFVSRWRKAMLCFSPAQNVLGLAENPAWKLHTFRSGLASVCYLVKLEQDDTA